MAETDIAPTHLDHTFGITQVGWLDKLSGVDIYIPAAPHFLLIEGHFFFLCDLKTIIFCWIHKTPRDQLAL